MLKLSHALPSLLTDTAKTKDSAFECLKTLMCFTLYQEGSLKAFSTSHKQGGVIAHVLLQFL